MEYDSILAFLNGSYTKGNLVVLLNVVSAIYVRSRSNYSLVQHLPCGKVKIYFYEKA